MLIKLFFKKDFTKPIFCAICSNKNHLMIIRHQQYNSGILSDIILDSFAGDYIKAIDFCYDPTITMISTFHGTIGEKNLYIDHILSEARDKLIQKSTGK